MVLQSEGDVVLLFCLRWRAQLEVLFIETNKSLSVIIQQLTTQLRPFATLTSQRHPALQFNHYSHTVKQRNVLMLTHCSNILERLRGSCHTRRKRRQTYYLKICSSFPAYFPETRRPNYKKQIRDRSEGKRQCC